MNRLDGKLWTRSARASTNHWVPAATLRPQPLLWGIGDGERDKEDEKDKSNNNNNKNNWQFFSPQTVEADIHKYSCVFYGVRVKLGDLGLCLRSPPLCIIKGEITCWFVQLEDLYLTTTRIWYNIKGKVTFQTLWIILRSSCCLLSSTCQSITNNNITANNNNNSQND